MLAYNRKVLRSLDGSAARGSRAAPSLLMDVTQIPAGVALHYVVLTCCVTPNLSQAPLCTPGAVFAAGGAFMHPLGFQRNPL